MSAMVSWFTLTTAIAALRQYAEKNEWVKLSNKDMENLEMIIDLVVTKGWSGLVEALTTEPEVSEVSTRYRFKCTLF